MAMSDWLSDSKLGAVAAATGTFFFMSMAWSGDSKLENPWPGLNWLCVAMTLLKSLFFMCMDLL